MNPFAAEFTFPAPSAAPEKSTALPVPAHGEPVSLRSSPLTPLTVHSAGGRAQAVSLKDFEIITGIGDGLAGRVSSSTLVLTLLASLECCMDSLREAQYNSLHQMPRYSTTLLYQAHPDKTLTESCLHPTGCVSLAQRKRVFVSLVTGLAHP